VTVEHPDDVTSPFAWLGGSDGWWNDLLSMIFAGSKWPEGSESAVWELTEEWDGLAEALSTGAEELMNAATLLMQGWDAPATESFQDLAQQLLSSPEFGLVGHIQNATAMGMQTRSFGTELQYAKISINVAVAVAVAAAFIALLMAWAGGVSLATLGPIAQTARTVVSQAISKLVSSAGRAAATRAITAAAARGAANAVARTTARDVARHLAHEVVEEVLEEVAIDATSQGIQFAQGTRTDWNVLSTVAAGIGGGAGGLIGAGAIAPIIGQTGLSRIGRGVDGANLPGAGNRLARTGTGLASTAATNTVASPGGSIVASLATGQGFPSLSGDDFLGAALGATGRYGTVSPFNLAVINAAAHPATTLANLHVNALAGAAAQNGALGTGSPAGAPGQAGAGATAGGTTSAGSSGTGGSNAGSGATAGSGGSGTGGSGSGGTAGSSASSPQAGASQAGVSQGGSSQGGASQGGSSEAGQGQAGQSQAGSDAAPAQAAPAEAPAAPGEVAAAAPTDPGGAPVAASPAAADPGGTGQVAAAPGPADASVDPTGGTGSTSTAATEAAAPAAAAQTDGGSPAAPTSGVAAPGTDVAAPGTDVSAPGTDVSAPGTDVSAPSTDTPGAQTSVGTDAQQQTAAPAGPPSTQNPSGTGTSGTGTSGTGTSGTDTSGTDTSGTDTSPTDSSAPGQPVTAQPVQGQSAPAQSAPSQPAPTTSTPGQPASTQSAPSQSAPSQSTLGQSPVTPSAPTATPTTGTPGQGDPASAGDGSPETGTGTPTTGASADTDASTATDPAASTNPSDPAGPTGPPGSGPTAPAAPGDASPAAPAATTAGDARRVARVDQQIDALTAAVAVEGAATGADPLTRADVVQALATIHQAAVDRSGTASSGDRTGPDDAGRTQPPTGVEGDQGGDPANSADAGNGTQDGPADDASAYDREGGHVGTGRGGAGVPGAAPRPGGDGPADGRDGLGRGPDAGAGQRGDGGDPRPGVPRPAAGDRSAGGSPAPDGGRDGGGRGIDAGERTTAGARPGVATGLNAPAERAATSEDVAGDHDGTATGASTRPRDDAAAWAWAADQYDAFRGTDADVSTIAGVLAETPRADGSRTFTRADVEQVKQHLMLDEHNLGDRWGDGPDRGRFDADPDIAEAWIRLQKGTHTEADVLLVEHELHESALMRADPELTYWDAHTATQQVFDWESVRTPRTGETREGLSYGDGDVRAEGIDGRPGDQLPVRAEPGRDGPAADDRPGDGRDDGDHRPRVLGGRVAPAPAGDDGPVARPGVDGDLTGGDPAALPTGDPDPVRGDLPVGDRPGRPDLDADDRPRRPGGPAEGGRGPEDSDDAGGDVDPALDAGGGLAHGRSDPELSPAEAEQDTAPDPVQAALDAADAAAAQALADLSADDRALLDARLERAQEVAARVSTDLHAVVGGLDGDAAVHKEQYRVKGPESVARKFDGALDDGSVTGLEQFLDRAKDLVRFSVVSAPEGYGPRVTTVLDALVARGYSVVETKNNWLAGNSFLGLNVPLVSPDGHLVELQFPTHASAAVGEATHRDYEIARLPQVSATDRLHATARMVSAVMASGADTVLPDGVDAFGPPRSSRPEDVWPTDGGFRSMVAEYLGALPEGVGVVDDLGAAGVDPRAADRLARVIEGMGGDRGGAPVAVRGLAGRGDGQPGQRDGQRGTGAGRGDVQPQAGELGGGDRSGPGQSGGRLGRGDAADPPGGPGGGRDGGRPVRADAAGRADVDGPADDSLTPGGDPVVPPAFGLGTLDLPPAFHDVVAQHLPPGMTTDRFDQLRRTRAEDLTPEERQQLHDVRMSVPLAPGTPVQRVMPLADAVRYLSDETSDGSDGRTRFAHTTAFGFTARLQDVAGLTTVAAIVEGLRLDYRGTPFTDDVPVVAALRFQRGAELAVPFGPAMADARPEGLPYTRSDDAPFTGTGFTGSVDHRVPEAHTGTAVRLTDGAELWAVADGREVHLGTYDLDSESWLATTTGALLVQTEETHGRPGTDLAGRVLRAMAGPDLPGVGERPGPVRGVRRQPGGPGVHPGPGAGLAPAGARDGGDGVRADLPVQVAGRDVLGAVPQRPAGPAPAGLGRGPGDGDPLGADPHGQDGVGDRGGRVGGDRPGAGALAGLSESDVADLVRLAEQATSPRAAVRREVAAVAAELLPALGLDEGRYGPDGTRTGGSPDFAATVAALPPQARAAVAVLGLVGDPAVLPSGLPTTGRAVGKVLLGGVVAAVAAAGTATAVGLATGDLGRVVTAGITGGAALVGQVAALRADRVHARLTELLRAAADVRRGLPPDALAVHDLAVADAVRRMSGDVADTAASLRALDDLAAVAGRPAATGRPGARALLAERLAGVTPAATPGRRDRTTSGEARADQLAVPPQVGPDATPARRAWAAKAAAGPLAAATVAGVGLVVATSLGLALPVAAVGGLVAALASVGLTTVVEHAQARYKAVLEGRRTAVEEARRAVRAAAEHAARSAAGRALDARTEAASQQAERVARRLDALLADAAAGRPVATPDPAADVAPATTEPDGGPTGDQLVPGPRTGPVDPTSLSDADRARLADLTSALDAVDAARGRSRTAAVARARQAAAGLGLDAPLDLGLVADPDELGWPHRRAALDPALQLRLAGIDELPSAVPAPGWAVAKGLASSVLPSVTGAVLGAAALGVAPAVGLALGPVALAVSAALAERATALGKERGKRPGSLWSPDAADALDAGDAQRAAARAAATAELAAQEAENRDRHDRLDRLDRDRAADRRRPRTVVPTAPPTPSAAVEVEERDDAPPPPAQPAAGRPRYPVAVARALGPAAVVVGGAVTVFVTATDLSPLTLVQPQTWSTLGASAVPALAATVGAAAAGLASVVAAGGDALAGRSGFDREAARAKAAEARRARWSQLERAARQAAVDEAEALTRARRAEARADLAAARDQLDDAVTRSRRPRLLQLVLDRAAAFVATVESALGRLTHGPAASDGTPPVDDGDARDLAVLAREAEQLRTTPPDARGVRVAEVLGEARRLGLLDAGPDAARRRTAVPAALATVSGAFVGVVVSTGQDEQLWRWVRTVANATGWWPEEACDCPPGAPCTCATPAQAPTTQAPTTTSPAEQPPTAGPRDMSPTPGTPTPGIPTPGTPSPGTPTPGTPTPGTPTRGAPTQDGTALGPPTSEAPAVRPPVAGPPVPGPATPEPVEPPWSAVPPRVVPPLPYAPRPTPYGSAPDDAPPPVAGAEQPVVDVDAWPGGVGRTTAAVVTVVAPGGSQADLLVRWVDPGPGHRPVLVLSDVPGASFWWGVPAAVLAAAGLALAALRPPAARLAGAVVVGERAGTRSLLSELPVSLVGVPALLTGRGPRQLDQSEADAATAALRLRPVADLLGRLRRVPTGS
jgi:hypothetical protein